MKEKFFAFLAFFIVLSAVTFAASPYFFSGYVHVNGSLAPNGTIVEVIVNGINRFNVTIGEGTLLNKPAGFYVISFTAESGNNVSFQVNGLNMLNNNGTNNATQVLTSANIIENFNLSANKSANTVACEVPLSCTGGFCVHAICRSASTFCGDSVCDSGETCTSCSGDCGACASSSSSGGGGGGGGGGPSLPSTTETVNSVPANTATTVKITEMKLPVSEVELTTKVTASNVQVTVKEVSAPSGVSAPISSDAGKIYKYIDITASGVDNSQLSKVKIKFKVAKTWFTQNSIEPATVKLSRLVGTAWTKLGTVQTGETAADILYEAETPGLSTFAVTGEKTSTPPSFSACGNNILETGEECDEQQLGGQTCVSKGYASGTLKCGANCKFDTSACVAAGQPPAEKPPEQPAQLPKLPEIPMDKVLIGIGLFALLLVAYYFWIHKKGKHVHVGTEHLQNK